MHFESMKNLAVVGLLALCAGAGAAAGAAEAPRAENIAPGIWRVRLGTPELHTPLSLHTAAPRFEPLADFPPAQTLPFDLDQLVFRPSGHGCAVALPMDKGEHIYGLGLSTKLFDMTDRRSFIRPSDDPENEWNDSHAPSPFYVSSRGYGVYVDTARYASFYTGNVEPVTRKPGAKTLLIDIPSAAGVDLYVFAGPGMTDAVRRYNLFSGGGCVPPLWGLGMAYRGLGAFTAAQSLQLAQSFRDDHIPCDIWGLEPGWQTQTYSSSFVWNLKGFPDPDAFIAQMHGLGYRLSVWEHAFTHPSSPMHDALKPFSGDYRVWKGLVPDFASPEARRIFVAHHEQLLFSKGIDMMKLDECDHQPASAKPWSFPEASVFPSGLDGEQMHSLFGVLYQQTMLEPYRKRNLRTWGLVRDSHALAAPLPYVVYSDSYNDRCYVRGLTKQGFAGLLWVPEVRDADSVEALYRRTQVVIFSPQAMINCWYMKLPPWQQINKAKNNKGELMAEREQATKTMRQLFELRMSLIPYLYSAFNEYRLRGTPPSRAMVMDWPDDPKTQKLDDQFMFGPSLLVAPLFTGQSKRSVYLPAGDWYDFWTHEKIAGGRSIEVAKPIEQIPVFVKGHTLLPLAKPVEHVANDTCFELTVLAFGTQPAAFPLFEDDGVSYDFEQGKQNQIKLTWDGQQGAEAKTGAYAGPARYKIAAWKSVP